MNLGEFHSDVSIALARGTALDARIPGRVKQAAGWLERNYTFSYMERFRLLQLEIGDRTVDFPTNEIIKGFKFCRLIDGLGNYTYLNKINPGDMTGLSTVGISAFWTVANRMLVLNSIPTERANGEAMWHSYTDWPTGNDARHTLIDIASDVLLAQTLMFMASFDLRDMRMYQVWKDVRTEGVDTLSRAEDETTYGGQKVSMVYVP